MSLTALKPVLREIRADGHITLPEAQKLITPENGLGLFTDKDELEVFTRLATDIKKSEPASTPSAQKVVDVNGKNKTRLVNKGIKIAGITSAVLSVLAVPLIFTVTGPVAPFLFLSLPLFIAASLGVGALAGFIRSKTHPVSAADIQDQTPKAVTAETYKQNPGVTVTGKISAAIAAVLGVGGVIGVTGFAFTLGAGSGASGIAAAFGAGTIFSAGIIGIPVLIGCSLMIGIGALIGRSITKARKKRLEGTPEGAVTASPEAKALINEVIAKGVTTPDQVAKGAKTGRKVGAIISGVIVGIGALIAVGAAITSGTGAAVAAAMWAFGLSLGAGGVFLVLGIAVVSGIGALVGYIKSRKNID